MDASRTILDTARRILRRRTDPTDVKLHKNFGLHLNTIVAVWGQLNRRVERARHGYTPANELLYALQFLRRYPKEEELLRDVGDASRYRRVVWKIVQRLPRVLPRVRVFFGPSRAVLRLLTSPCGQLPWSTRAQHNECPDGPQNLSFVVDTFTQQTYQPKLPFHQLTSWMDVHKHTWGVKWEVAVVLSRRPRLVWFSGPYRAGESDVAIARCKNGILENMEPGERGLGDPGYVGAPGIVCPPRSNMDRYVAGIGDVGLTLQRVVERMNRLIRSWAIMKSYRGSPVHMFDRIRAAGLAVASLTSLDMRLNKYSY
jgi:hypothetical protein